MVWHPNVHNFKNKLRTEVWTTLISVFVGGLIAFFSAYGYDFIKEGKERKELANIFYLEIQNNLLNVLVYLNQMGNRDDFIKHDTFVANDFNYQVFNAYIKDIRLFSSLEAVKILCFYGDLTKADEAKHMIAGNLNIDKRIWLGYVYDNYLYSIDYAKFLISDFEKVYKVIPSKEVTDDINNQEVKLIKNNPSLISKIINGPNLP
jgi:hypothetical protein